MRSVFLNSNNLSDKDINIVRIVCICAFIFSMGSPSEAFGQAHTPSADREYSHFFQEGLERMGSGDYEGAIAKLDKALVINSSSFEAYFHRGRARVALGDKPEGIADFSKALAINPNFAPAYFHRGLARHALGHFEEAIGDFKQVLNYRAKFRSSLFSPWTCKT